jgi:hypothetical protein
MNLAKAILQQLANVPEYSGPGTGRGYVLAGGGDYEAGNFVAASMLRKRSNLPIVLVRRPAELLRLAMFEQLDVAVVTVPDAQCQGWRNGWPIKSWCLTSGVLPFSDVHFIDSDVVPWGDPEKAFQAGSGAWYCTNHHEAINWAAYGVAPRNHAIDGGVWRLDTHKLWKVAYLYDWLNRHVHQVSYQYGVGDQDQLRAALAACEIDATLGGGTVYQGPGLIHDAGYTHRYADKFRTRGGHRLGHWPWPQKHTGVPGEKEAYDFFKQYWKLSSMVPPS